MKCTEQIGVYTHLFENNHILLVPVLTILLLIYITVLMMNLNNTHSKEFTDNTNHFYYLYYS